jgi:hypothetical protein
MINSISSNHAHTANQPARLLVRPPQPQQSSALPKDTVTLNKTGDVNHDGDKK